jgi:two-component system, response regulator
MNEPDIKAEFAKAVRLWRGQLGLSQEQLAERANLHRTYISDVERGTRNLSLESINKLARALEVSVPTLFATSDAGARKAGSHKFGPGLKEFVDILLVEDDPNDVELTLQAFKEYRFANLVHVVRDGAEALDYVFCRGAYAQRRSKDRPQVILLDLNLPKISGVEFLYRIKADKRTRLIPVVVLIGSLKDRDIAECRRLGAETCIVKPVNFQRLSEITPQLDLNWALFRPVDVSQNSTVKPGMPA